MQEQEQELEEVEREERMVKKMWPECLRLQQLPGDGCRRFLLRSKPQSSPRIKTCVHHVHGFLAFFLVVSSPHTVHINVITHFDHLSLKLLLAFRVSLKEFKRY